MDARGLVTAVLVTHVSFGALLLLTAIPYIVQSPAFVGWTILSIVIIFLVAGIPMWGFGLIIEAMLGVCLRRIRNQWVHVAAFITVGALAGVATSYLIPPNLVTVPVCIAFAAGIGRLAIWRLVHINDQPSLT